MKLLKNLLKVTVMFFILFILLFIIVSPFISSYEDDNIYIFISIPLAIMFLAIIKTYDIDNFLK